MESDKQAKIDALRARRAARGASDPLNRLSAYIAAAIAAGAEPIQERTGHAKR